MVKKDDAKDSKTLLTSVRIPRDTLKALQRRAKRKNMSQNAFIVAVLNQALGLSDEFFDTNPPLPTDEAIANLQARLATIEKQLGIIADNPFVSEPVEDEVSPTREDGLLTKDEAVAIAIERGLAPDGKEIKTPAAKRFANAYTDFANGKSKKNPEETWAIRRVDNPDGSGYLYEDLKVSKDLN
jgi:hypothetical protein